MPVNRTGDRDEGLSSLLLDVLNEEPVEAELLARFAADPASLAPEDRLRLDAALAASSALRDQLRMLQSPEIARVLAEQPLRPATQQAPAETLSLVARVRAFLASRSGLLLAPLAAAALLALVFFANRPSEPLQTAPSTGQQVARVEPLPKPEVRPPTAPPEPPVAPVAPGAETAPQPKPSLRESPPPRVKSAPEPEPPVAMDYVAMAEPVYRAPADAVTHDDAQTYVRGAGPALRLLALVPPHSARTVSAHPELPWYLSELPPAPARFELTLTLIDQSDPLMRRELAAPTHSGDQRIRLDELGIELPEGREVRWTVALRVDPENPSRDLVASGWIERVPESEELRADLAAAKPLDRASLYASSGLWYDAVAELSRVAERAPNETTPRRYLAQLFERAGLPHDPVPTK
jgi:hypothetical protein